LPSRLAPRFDCEVAKGKGKKKSNDQKKKGKGKQDYVGLHSHSFLLFLHQNRREKKREGRKKRKSTIERTIPFLPTSFSTATSDKKGERRTNKQTEKRKEMSRRGYYVYSFNLLKLIFAWSTHRGGEKSENKKNKAMTVGLSSTTPSRQPKPKPVKKENEGKKKTG